MSPALSDLPVRRVIRALESVGFSHVRTKGSHAVYGDRDGRVAIIPQHGVVKLGTTPRGDAPRLVADFAALLIRHR